MGQEGLHVIFPGTDPEIDIVAIHGLNFKKAQNHAWETWTSGQKLWLKDFLPDSLPRPARVLLFEYNSSPAIGATATKLDDHAKNLLQWLALKRKAASRRPLVFISHSLGGLVAKEALVEATLNPKYKSIVDATRLLVFFATPHQGGNYASVGEVVAKIARECFHTPDNGLLKLLQKDSDEATRRFEQSRHLYESCLVVSFFESLSYGELGLIVDKKSAALNLPGTRETQVAMHADHSSICKFDSPDSPACELVIDTISTELERALELGQAGEPESVNEHWLVPRSTHPLFIGRDGILGKIRNAFFPKNWKGNSRPRRFILTGIGGQGKSEVCLRFADQFRDAFWGVFWVDVSSEVTATEGFRKILEMIDPQKRGYPTKTIDDALHQLANTGRKNDWLLVLDNADDPQTDYSRYIPSGTRGAVLITSRDPQCSAYGTSGTEELGALSEEDSISLLLSAANIPKDRRLGYTAAAKTVISDLKSHTLALLQAGGYIAQGHCSLDKYPEEYRKQCKRLLQFTPKQAQPRYRSVYATFESSVQVLGCSQTDMAQDSLALLGILSSLHYEGVPLDLFEDAWKGSKYAQNNSEDEEMVDSLSNWHVSQLPTCIVAENDDWDSFRLSSALSLLQSLALIQRTRSRSIETVSIHPLIHQWLLLRQDSLDQIQSGLRAGCLLALSRYRKPEWRPYRDLLRPHLQSLLRTKMEYSTHRVHRPITQILMLCGWLLEGLRLDNELDELLQRAPLLADIGLGSLSDINIPFHILSARNKLSLGQTKQAVEIFEHVVKVQRTTLDEGQPNRLTTEHALASAYLADGQTKKAVKIFEHVARVQSTTLGKSHAYRLATEHMLACAYLADGRTKLAVDIFEHVAQIRRETLDEGHPDRLITTHALASTYLTDGRTKLAVDNFEHVAQAKRKALDKGHPDRLATEHDLARAYLADGQTKLAVEIFEHVAQVRRETLDEGHPDRLATENALACVYLTNGQTKLAVEIFEHVAKARRTILDEGHPDRLATEHALASAYLADGQAKLAVEIFEHVAQVQRATLDKDHPDQLTTKHELARAYLADKQTKLAVEIFEHVAQAQKATLNEKHPYRLATEHTLAYAYLADGQTKLAVKIFEHVAKIRSTTLDKYHPDRLATEHELARACLANGQTKLAVEIFEHVAQVRRVILDEDHPDRLATETALASAYFADGRTRETNSRRISFQPIRRSMLRDFVWGVFASSGKESRLHDR